jgi:hypothetical protein
VIWVMGNDFMGGEETNKWTEVALECGSDLPHKSRLLSLGRYNSLLKLIR